MALVTMNFNVTGLMKKLEELERAYQEVPGILREVHSGLTEELAVRALANLEESERGHDRWRSGRLEEALVAPGNRYVSASGFLFGIESFLDEATPGRGVHGGYWRQIEETGVQGWTTAAAFTFSREKGSSLFSPSGDERGEHPFMPQFRGSALQNFADDNAHARASAWRTITIPSRPAYGPIQKAVASLTPQEIGAAYKAAFAAKGIDLTLTNFGSRIRTPSYGYLTPA